MEPSDGFLGIGYLSDGLEPSDGFTKVNISVNPLDQRYQRSFLLAFSFFIAFGLYHRIKPVTHSSIKNMEVTVE
jgi:hypothetical protein